MLRWVEPNPPLAPHQKSGSSYKEGILHFSTMGMFYFPVEMHTLRASPCVRMHRLTGVRSWRNKTLWRKGISGSECLTPTCNSQPDWLFCPSPEWVTVTGQGVFPEKDCVDADVLFAVAVCLLSHYWDLQLWETRFLATILLIAMSSCTDVLVSQMMNPDYFDNPLTFVVLSEICPDYCLKVNFTNSTHWNVFMGPVE